MADDARARTAILLRLGGERRHSACVIDVAVGINCGVDAVRRPSTHHRNRLGLIVMSASIDQHQALLGFDRSHVREPSPEHHACGDLLRLARRGQRMALADRKLAALEFLRLFLESHFHTLRANYRRTMPPAATAVTFPGRKRCTPRQKRSVAERQKRSVAERVDKKVRFFWVFPRPLDGIADGRTCSQGSSKTSARSRKSRAPIRARC